MSARDSGGVTLRSDQRGAIVVMSIPIALFLIGMLHYAIGVGDAIIHRETLQDAADASAFSAAVMMARGMNLVVLVNVIMATLMALLVMLRLTQVMIVVGIGLCVALTMITAGATAKFVAPLRAAEVSVRNAYIWTKQVVDPTLLALYEANRVLRYAMPIAAQVRVVDTSRQYAPPAIVGFAIPNRFPLPTEDGTPEQLCGKAGEYAAVFATLPVRALLPEIVLDAIEDGLSSATESLSLYFCTHGSMGSPDVSMPDTPIRMMWPKLPLTRECEDHVNTTGRVDPDHQRACDAAQRQVQMSEPDPRTGDCGEQDCADYELRAALARGECKPPGRKPFKEWVWQVRTVHLRADWHKRDPYPVYVEHEDVVYDEPMLMRTDRPPCGVNGVVDTGWNTDATQPLCVEPHPELEPEGLVTRDVSSTDELVLEVSYREVLNVFGCVFEVTKVSPHNGPVPDDSPPIIEPPGQSRCGDGVKRVHQNVKADAVLGDETFQLRAVVTGETGPIKHRNVLESMVLHEANTQLPWQGRLNLGNGLRQASRVFVAQAEYYFDADLDADTGRDRLEWMWTMDWRARLVRFRLAAPQSRGSASRPSASQRCGVAEAVIDTATSCTEANGGGWCGAVDELLDGVSDFIIH